MSKSQKYLIYVCGPTAVGKTAVAIALAKTLHTEILSSDSRQFYKEISIGTAKPSPQELQEVPHHFIGQISIEQTYNAGDFEREALAKLESLFTRYDQVIMVGGSGLYGKAVIEGLDEMPKANELLRNELHNLFESKGLIALQDRLRTTAPSLYESTEVMNPQRLMRAIEVAESGFKALPKDKTIRDFKTVVLGINMPREALYERINGRVDQMMAAGLEMEARMMLPFRDAYALQTVGYKELFDCFDGQVSMDQAIGLIKQHTRNYAKRQLTWFRKDNKTTWFGPEEVSKMLDHLKHQGVKVME